MWVWGCALSGVQGQSPLSGGLGGEAPTEAEHNYTFHKPIFAEFWCHFGKIQSFCKLLKLGRGGSRIYEMGGPSPPHPFPPLLPPLHFLPLPYPPLPFPRLPFPLPSSSLSLPPPPFPPLPLRSRAPRCG